MTVFLYADVIRQGLPPPERKTVENKASAELLVL
jgi:hypothetical protein